MDVSGGQLHGPAGLHSGIEPLVPLQNTCNATIMSHYCQSFFNILNSYKVWDMKQQKRHSPDERYSFELITYSNDILCNSFYI